MVATTVLCVLYDHLTVKKYDPQCLTRPVVPDSMVAKFLRILQILPVHGWCSAVQWLA